MNTKEYLILIFIIIVIMKISLFFTFIYSTSIKEQYANCPDNVFCSFDINENKCKCVLQKDDVHSNFPIDNNCCKEDCQKKDINNCNNTDKNVNYWCPIAGKCLKYTANINANQVSSNNCGYDVLNNQFILPFSSEGDCLKQLDPCEKYNDMSLTKTQRITNCLKDINCGTCSTADGDEKCISGTSSGPIDLAKYYYCDPTNKESTNKYVYGNNSAYILQK
jgi:hypothetical protein